MYQYISPKGRGHCDYSFAPDSNLLIVPALTADPPSQSMS